MDLASLDIQKAAEKGVSVELAHPVTGEPLLDDAGQPIEICVLGKDSEKWQSVAKKINTRNAARYKDRKIPAAVVESALYEILAECTTVWSGIVYNGEELECNADNARMLYSERTWIAEQLIVAAADRSNYFLK